MSSAPTMYNGTMIIIYTIVVVVVVVVEIVVVIVIGDGIAQLMQLFWMIYMFITYLFCKQVPLPEHVHAVNA